MICRVPETNEWDLKAGSIWIRVFTTSIAEEMLNEECGRLWEIHTSHGSMAYPVNQVSIHGELEEGVSTAGLTCSIAHLQERKNCSPVS